MPDRPVLGGSIAPPAPGSEDPAPPGAWEGALAAEGVRGTVDTPSDEGWGRPGPPRPAVEAGHTTSSSMSIAALALEHSSADGILESESPETESDGDSAAVVTDRDMGGRCGASLRPRPACLSRPRASDTVPVRAQGAEATLRQAATAPPAPACVRACARVCVCVLARVCVRARACVCACARACVRARACVCACARACVCVCVCADNIDGWGEAVGGRHQ